MKPAVLYIHGKDGSAEEAEYYKRLFPDHEVRGLDYKGTKPWEVGEEIKKGILDTIADHYFPITIVANSIGAYYCMISGVWEMVKKAYFISPIIDMENVIVNMMMWAGVDEAELKEKQIIPTPYGENLSWEYLCYVREHPPVWNVKTEVLYGSEDDITTIDSMIKFCRFNGFGLTVMDGGEHWFHTEEEMKFLDKWIISSELWG